MTNNNYNKNILTLIYGSGIAHLIPILSAPLLTRLYSPDHFGIFGFYLSLISLLSIVSSGRYQLAVLLPEKDKESSSLVTISILSNIVFCIVLYIFIYFSHNINWLSSIYSKLGGYIYIVPISVLLLSLFDIINYVLNRKGNYDGMRNTRIFRSLFSQISSMFMGVYSLGAIGLIFGNMFGNIIPLIINRKQISMNYDNIKKNISKYSEFPLYQMPTSVLNTFSNESPIYFFTAFFTLEVVGYYALAHRLFSMPISLIATSVSQVFYKESAELYNQKKSTKLIYFKTLRTLIFISLPIALFLFFFSENLFSIIFGENWIILGRYIKYLVPAFFMRFITSPLSTILIVKKQIKLLSIWKTIYFISSTVTLFICCYNFSSIDYVIITYSCHEVVLYLFYLILQIKSNGD